MLFNSIEFLLFLPIVFVLYWFVFNKNFKQQNLLILVSSYFFYGWWDYRFLSLIILSTIVDYVIGLKISSQSSRNNQKKLLLCSVLFNLGILGFFKYYNFFIVINDFNKRELRSDDNHFTCSGNKKIADLILKFFI